MHIPTFTLLIVEDLATHRSLYREHLSHDSNCVYDILEAESVAAGLALCRSRSIDAILLDYLLPDGDGLAFLAALDTQSNGSSPPVVMLTGIGNEGVAVRAMKLGAEDYLVKCDVTTALLQSTMRSAIENTRLRLQLQQSQEQAKLLLQAKNQQITTIWESMTDAYVTLDRDWRIVYTNPTATELVRQLVDLVPEEFLGKSYWEVFPWTVGNIVEQEYRRAVTDRVAVHFEVLYEPTGTWFEIHAYPSEIGLGIYFRDIDERKRNQLARSQAEREIDRFFDLAIDLLVVANFDRYFVRVNPGCERILGFNSAELMAQSYLDLVHPDDREHTLAAAQGLSQGETIPNFENRYRCKDGSYRWILWSAIPNVDRQLIYANGRDITERKQAESIFQAQQATIQQQLGEIESIYQMAPVGLCFVDTDFRYVRINEQLAQINGLSVAEHIGKTFREVLPELVDTMEPVYRQVMESGEPIINLEVTGTNRAQPGVERCWLASFYPQTDDRGRVIGVNNVVQEITAQQAALRERQRQSAALLQSERKFSAIFNQTFQLMGLVSLDGVLLEVNQAALDSIAAPESEIVGKCFWDAPWWHTEQLQQQLRDAIATAASGQFVRYEVEFLNPSGGVSITDFSLKPMFDEVGRVESIVAEAHDITERKQAQAALEQRNQELDSFVYVVSHDLKAPLRGIANLSEWIEEDLAGSLSVANQEQMTLLRSRVYKMQATIDGLLDYARSGSADETIESVSIAELLADVIDSIAPPPTFTIELPLELPTLSTQRLPLFQVFANLIGNGIKHHDRLDGSIQILVKEEDDFCEFVITDDGPGIPLEHHDRIFTIFQAVNPQNRSDSTGIGLAIVKKIIEAQGGRIWLDKDVKQGTRFCFTWLKIINS